MHCQIEKSASRKFLRSDQLVQGAGYGAGHGVLNRGLLMNHSGYGVLGRFAGRMRSGAKRLSTVPPHSIATRLAVGPAP